MFTGMRYSRRGFLWGVALAPLVARPLRALRFPVREHDCFTMWYWCREFDDSTKSGTWVQTEVEWKVDANGYAHIVHVYEDGREVPLRQVHFGVRPTINPETGKVGICAALPAVGHYGISDTTLLDNCKRS